VNPKITIVIPVFNASMFLERSLNSALSQDYDNFDIVVVDNESTDDSYEKLVLMQQQVNNFVLGQVANSYKYSWHEPTRFGLKLMSRESEYFMFLAADDYLEKGFLTNSWKYISKSPEHIKLLQSPIKFFGDWQHEQKFSYKNIEEFKSQFLIRCPVNTPTVIWHRSFYDNGVMEETDSLKYAGADDYMLYGYLANNNNFIYPASKYLGYNYRIHGGQATWGMHKECGEVDKKIQTYWKGVWNA
jgi:glycosyltransferase involved in cell wall biosynthesis